MPYYLIKVKVKETVAEHLVEADNKLQAKAYMADKFIEVASLKTAQVVGAIGLGMKVEKVPK